MAWISRVFDVPVLLDLLNSTDYAPRRIIVEVLHQSDVTRSHIGLSSIAGCYRMVAQTLPNIILETVAD